MTDDATDPDTADEPAKWDAASDPDGYTRADVRSKDFLLDVLMDFVFGDKEEAGGSFGLTVTLGGQVVSGMAITRGEWMDAVASQYEGAGGTEYLRQVFTKVHEGIVADDERREAADLPSRARRFIHMRDVRIVNGTQWTEMAYWRGALADVTGWSLGSWS
jgi:hypothetical protein